MTVELGPVETRAIKSGARAGTLLAGGGKPLALAGMTRIIKLTVTSYPLRTTIDVADMSGSTGDSGKVITSVSYWPLNCPLQPVNRRAIEFRSDRPAGNHQGQILIGLATRTLLDDVEE